MSTVLVDTVKKIIDMYGVNIVLNAKKFIAVFSDLAPQLKKEKKILTIALNEGIGQFFVNVSESEQKSSLARAYRCLDGLLAPDAIDLILNCFCEVFGWKMWKAPPATQNETISKQKSIQKSVQKTTQIIPSQVPTTSADNLPHQSPYVKPKKRNVFFGILVVVGLLAAVIIVVKATNFSFNENSNPSDTSSSEKRTVATLNISDDNLTIDMGYAEPVEVNLNVLSEYPNLAFDIIPSSSELVTLNCVSKANRWATYELIPHKKGAGQITFTLTDGNNHNVIHDSITLDLEVTGPSSYGTFGNHAYQTFDNGLSWSEAKEFCQEKGGHLVTIESSEENEFVARLSKSIPNEFVWLGALSNPHDGTWSWIDASLWSFDFWDETTNSHGDTFTRDHNLTDTEYYLCFVNHNRTYESWSLHDGYWHDVTNVDDCIVDGYFPFQLSSFGFVCEWDYISNSLVKGLTATSKRGYDGPTDIQDCFGNNFSSESTFTMTLAGPNEVSVNFDCKNVTYKTLDYDISLAQTTKDAFVGYNSDFSLGMIDICAILSDGSKKYIHDTFKWIDYDFFERDEPVHQHITLPDDTVEIRFEGGALQDYASIKLIIANTYITTE